MAIAATVSKYNKQQSKGDFKQNYHKIAATRKWVEYSLDIMDMQREMMQTKNYDLKCSLLEALEVAERKRQWMYNHKNFNLEKALSLFNILKNIPIKDNNF
jgi:hypothetical protein